MDPVPEEKLIFDAQWYRAEAAVTYQFVLHFFTKDNSVELVRKLLSKSKLWSLISGSLFQIDKKTNKFFLRRTHVDTVCARDLFPNARIFLFGRKIHVTDYASLETKQLLSSKLQK